MQGFTFSQQTVKRIIRVVCNAWRCLEERVVNFLTGLFNTSILAVVFHCTILHNDSNVSHRPRTMVMGRAVAVTEG